ncbi:MAG: acetyl ornithine aminotransferase family protein [candidate division WOR-3 bacterium]
MTQHYINREVPGEKARAVLRRDRKYISPSLTRPYPAVIERGKGMYVWDVDGNRFLDFAAGIAVCATGHCHDDVVEAIKKQSETLIHISGADFYTPLQSQLAEKLAEISPGSKNKRVFLGNSGAEAVEAAMKLSRFKKHRPKFIAFLNAFHGRTLGALSLTASKAVQRRHFAPLFDVVHVPYPYCYRCFLKQTYPKCDYECLSFIEERIFKTIAPPEDCAAWFIEPIQGEGGYVVPPPGYFSRLAEICNRYDIFLVDDEVQSGMGRSGRMFAIEHWNVKADLYCIGKGIASGLPLSACISKAGIMDWSPGTHASTFGGNPVACASALKTIELLEGGLIDNAEKMGEIILKKLNGLKKRYEFIGDVRGKGLMIGIELVLDQDSKEPVPEKRDGVVVECFKRGLLILGAGQSSIRFCPPLIIKEAEIEIGMEIFESALTKIFLTRANL